MTHRSNAASRASADDYLAWAVPEVSAQGRGARHTPPRRAVLPSETMRHPRPGGSFDVGRGVTTLALFALVSLPTTEARASACEEDCYGWVALRPAFGATVPATGVLAFEYTRTDPDLTSFDETELDLLVVDGSAVTVTGTLALDRDFERIVWRPDAPLVPGELYTAWLRALSYPEGEQADCRRPPPSPTSTSTSRPKSTRTTTSERSSAARTPARPRPAASPTRPRSTAAPTPAARTSSSSTSSSCRTSGSAPPVSSPSRGSASARRTRPYRRATRPPASPRASRTSSPARS